MKAHRVVVFLTDEELLRAKEAAGQVPLSRWLRTRALGLRSSEVMKASGEGLVQGSAVAYEFGVGAGSQKISEPAVDVKAATRPRKSVAKKPDTAGYAIADPPAMTVAGDLCSHNYAEKKCPFPSCANYKWRKT